MAGKPFKVGRFAHTLRVRLMREHLGVDVDSLYEEELLQNEPVADEQDLETWDPDQEQEHGKDKGVTRVKKKQRRTPVRTVLHDTADAMEQALWAGGEATSRDINAAFRHVGVKAKNTTGIAEQALKEERRTYARDGGEQPGFASAVVPTQEETIVMEHRPSNDQTEGNDKALEDKISKSDLTRDGNTQADGAMKEARVHDQSEELYGAPANARTTSSTDDRPPRASGAKDDATGEESEAPETRGLLRKHLEAPLGSQAWTLPTPKPKVEANGFGDPICDEFWKNVWLASAVHNVRFPSALCRTCTDLCVQTEIYRKVFHGIPDDLVTTWKQYKEFIMHHERLNKPLKEDGKDGPPLARIPSEARDEDAPGQKSVIEADQKANPPSTGDEPAGKGPNASTDAGVGSGEGDTKARKPARADEPFERWERDEMEKLLGELCGHLGELFFLLS